MNPETVVQWLMRTEPRTPGSFRGRLETALEGVAHAAPDMPRLEGAAHAELEEARRHLGRNRESAFHLLVADGLLTSACAMAAETPAPGASLARLLVPFDRADDS
jgi:hypothetical protein